MEIVYFFFHDVSMTMQDAGIQPVTHEYLHRRLATFLRTSDRPADYRHFLPGPDDVQQSSSAGADVEPPDLHDAEIERMQDPKARQHARWKRYLDWLEHGA